MRLFFVWIRDNYDIKSIIHCLLLGKTERKKREEGKDMNVQFLKVSIIPSNLIFDVR